MKENIIFIVAALLSLGLGMGIYFYPLKVFELQKKFYALINWKIEPISLSKEIRNTRIMGLFLVIFVLLCVCVRLNN